MIEIIMNYALFTQPYIFHGEFPIQVSKIMTQTNKKFYHSQCRLILSQDTTSKYLHKIYIYCIISFHQWPVRPK